MNERERERERKKIGIVGTKLHEEIDPIRFHFDRADAEFRSSIPRFSIHSSCSEFLRGEGVYHSILFDEFVYAFERHGRIVSKRDGKILEIFSTMLLKEEIYMYIYSLDVIVYGKIGTSIFYSRYTNIHLVSRIMTFVF